MNLWGLRPYQEEAVVSVESAWRSGVRTVCFQCATGSGKTRIFRQIVDNHAAAKKIIYVIAHRKNLVKQLSGELDDAEIKHGIISPENPYIRYRVQVASLQTLTRRIGKVESPELIIIDEAHHCKAASYMRILEAWPQALVLGVTATPARLDGSPLSDVFRKLICGPPMKWLIEHGYLCDYEYYAPQTVQAPKHMTHGEYRLDEVAELMDKRAIIGNAVEHYRKHADGAPAIASCASILHAEHVAAGFRSAGYRSTAIHSQMDQRSIETALAGLKDGSVQVITQCELIGEGIDIPGATVLIGLRHTASLTIFLQHIGRVLRMADGKRHAVILDHVGNYLRHGLPDDDREWTLAGRSKREQSETLTKRCPDCFHVVRKTARVCEYCGHEWTAGECQRELPQEAEGTLAAVRRSTVRISWYELIAEIRNRARNLKEAHAIAKAAGYAPGAAWSVWKNILNND